MGTFDITGATNITATGTVTGGTLTDTGLLGGIVLDIAGTLSDISGISTTVLHGDGTLTQVVPGDVSTNVYTAITGLGTQTQNLAMGTFDITGATNITGHRHSHRWYSLTDLSTTLEAVDRPALHGMAMPWCTLWRKFPELPLYLVPNKSGLSHRYKC